MKCFKTQNYNFHSMNGKCFSFFLLLPCSWILRGGFGLFLFFAEHNNFYISAASSVWTLVWSENNLTVVMQKREIKYWLGRNTKESLVDGMEIGNWKKKHKWIESVLQEKS